MVVLPEKILRPRTVGRLCIYRRVLNQLLEDGSLHIFSRDLAKLAGVSASQVRQDLMNVPTCGTPQNGYAAIELLLSVNKCLGLSTTANAIMLGAGHLGQAVLHHFKTSSSHLEMKAIFDIDSRLVGQDIYNTPILPLTELKTTITQTPVQVAILAVPSTTAQTLAEQLASYGICSILNFTPTMLNLPAHVYVENNDIQTSLERVAYYAAAKIGNEAKA